MQIAAVVGIVGGTGFLMGALYKIYKVAHRVDAAIGTDEQGRTMSDRMNRVEYQLWENGGGSLKDQMNETTDLSRQTATEVQLLKEILLQFIGAQEKPKRSKKSAA